MDELMDRSALEQAKLVRSGAVSAAELVQASLERIDARDGAVNAFTWLDPDRALAAAREIGAGDGRPFAGVPVAVKDLLAPMAGVVETQGSDLLGDRFRPPFDAYAVRRLREAGFVIVGRTNTPEFGIMPVTEPRRFGPTRNPHDLARGAGGSSGGSAAAVAAGMVPAALGSDGGGSIRIPAAACGLVGLKPARGRVSPGPLLGEQLLNCHGGLVRTVADCAALLDVLAGYETGDTTWAPPPAEPFAAAARREPGRLRIGRTSVPPYPVDVDPTFAAAFEHASELLEELGHEVVDVTPPWSDPALFQVFMVLWCSLAATSVDFAASIAGREPDEENLERLTLWMYEQGKATSAVELHRALVTLQGAGRAIVAAQHDLDALLTPGLAQLAPPVGAIDADGPDPQATWAASAAFTPFTAVFNLSGQPAVSLPWWLDGEALPRAIQLAGRPAGEAQLLALAAQVEAARPFSAPRAPSPWASG